MNRRQFCGLSLGAAAAAAGWEAFFPRAARAQGGPFFFRDGDRVVMIGDSITEQLLHSNYVEVYTLSRFPHWKLAFRNVGIGGDTSPGGNARTERDILSFKPTAVTITFGMNDGGYRQPHDPARLERYRAGLQGILQKLKPHGVRAAVLSSSPVEKAEDGRALEGYNQTLELFAAAAKEVAQANAAVFVDQFHPHVEALQRARDAAPANRINGGDPVHPGAPGQMLMAWAILKGPDAPSLVSTAEVDAGAGRAGAAEQCVLTAVRKKPQGVTFVRTDRALPFWIPPAARPILKWAPIENDLDRYPLKVTGLAPGSYEVRIDGQSCARATAEELGRGLNLALLTEGPVAAQAKALSDAVFAKNRYYHDQIFRGVVLNAQVPADGKAALIEERMKGMEPLEQAIRDACVLRPHVYEVTLTQ